MNKRNDRQSGGAEQEFSELLRSAGRGPRLSEAARSRIHAAAESAWRDSLAQRRSDDSGSRDGPVSQYAENAQQRQPRRVQSGASRYARRRRRWLVPAFSAAAAALVAVLYLGSPIQSPSIMPAGFAQVVATQGDFSVERDGTNHPGGSAPDGGDEFAQLRIGDRISTAATGRLALLLPTGIRLSINAGSTIELTSQNSVRLAIGMLYFDSPPDAPGTPFAVQTDLGTVNHVGTQYVAGIEESQLFVRVREGQAAVADPDRTVLASVGEQVRIDTNGTVQRTPFAIDHPDWDWTEALARTSFDGPASVLELLQWAARATGREIQWESDIASMRARNVILNGVSDLSPDELIDVIGSTTEFDVVQSAGVMDISLR